ncbi:MAG: GAF domain-containing protein [Anaerolineales bacterium]|nr:GAF domain-containing protein [Anaerolineales bacterium]
MNAIISFLRKAVQPHPSITNADEGRRAQLLAILSLGQMFFATLGLLSGPGSLGVFIVLWFVALVCYIFSRTRFPKVGTYILSYFITSIAYVRIFYGTTDSIDTAIGTSVHISLILASALLSSNGFLILAIISTLAAALTPFYSHVPVNSFDSIPRTAGITFSIGLILYSVNLFRARLDRSSLQELREANTELTDIKSNLEKRVEDRTADLQKAGIQIERRAARLQAASEISQAISADVEKDFKELLNETVSLISEKTGYYHTGIFILDQNNEFAVLRAANSEGGQKMLARQHQLKVGGAGIVGYVSQSGRPRIALDTGADAVFFNNPDLPETRSEMALPLKVGTKIIGVLDIQSTQSSAFDNEDAVILGTLANQISMIIQNSLISNSSGLGAGYFNQSTIWNRGERSKGYSYLPDGSIAVVPDEENPLIKRSLASGQTIVQDKSANKSQPALAVPVRIRDTIIGVIHIEASQANRKWSEDEVALAQAISERAALALENARLFEETERSAERERVISLVTSRIGESNKLENILHTTIQELGRTLGASRAFIQLETPSVNGSSPLGDDHE